MSYTTTGRIKVINDTQTFPSGFQKREFVITTPDDKYPQDIKFELTKDRVERLDQLAIGDLVEVEFDIRGNEYNSKYYVNLSAWRVKATELADTRDTATTTQSPPQEPTRQQPTSRLQDVNQENLPTHNSINTGEGDLPPF